MKQNKRLLSVKKHVSSSDKVSSLLQSKKGLRIDIGCGENKQAPDWVGIDYRPMPGVDIVQNLEQFPWPIPSEVGLCALSSHVVEHIDPHGGVFIDFMNEVWRILRPGAEFFIATPYAGSPGYWRDPTHCNPCTEETWTYFDPEDNFYRGGLYRVYRPLPWKIKVNTWQNNGNLEIVLVKRDIEKKFNVTDYYMDVLKKHTNETKKYEKK